MIDYDKVIAPASPFQERYLNNNSRFLIVGGAMGCVDGDTEYLGELGWRKIKDYAGEAIYQYCPLLDERSLTTPKIVKEIGEEMYKFSFYNKDNSKVLWDMVLTLDHKVLYYETPISKPSITNVRHLVNCWNKDKVLTGFIKTFDGVSSGWVELNNYTIEKTLPKDKLKWCFITDDGWWVARRSGMSFITGNSSKSYVGLMRFLRYTNDPHMAGVIIRKNMKAITAVGGLWDEAQNLYKKVYPNLKTNITERKMVFPSGGTVAFQHYENAKARDNFQGLNLDERHS